MHSIFLPYLMVKKLNSNESKNPGTFVLQPTVLAMVPPLVSFLATHPMVKSSHLASVNVMTGGAAPFGPALIDKFLDKCKPNVVKFREGEYSSHGARYGHHKLSSGGYIIVSFA